MSEHGPPRTALVTGATGLVGWHVARRFRAEGWSVRALVRAEAGATSLADAGVALHRGDILDEDAFVRAAAGCDVVVHAAAAIFHADGWTGYEALNVRGAANAVAAASATDARLVQVSSVAVYGPGMRYREDGRLTDEASDRHPLPASAHYARSKRASEDLVLEAHAAGRVWASAVRPAVVYGRRDRQFVPRMARLIRLGVVPVVGGGGSTMALVHADNVADGIVRTATSDVAGGRAYNLANDFAVTVAEFFRWGAEGLGAPFRRIAIPLAPARALARLAEVLAPLAGFDPSVVSVRASLDYITRDNPFTSERARAELGWMPSVRHEDGVRDAFRWWREHGT